MPTKEQQNSYLFKSCTDLFPRGLAKARPVGPERAAAFSAGYVYGRSQALLNAIQQGILDHDLAQAYEIGARIGQESFEPPKWAMGPFTPTEDEPLDNDIDAAVE